MVLSNKKLKRKLRDLAAESQGVAPTSDAQGNDVNQQLQSINEILNSKSKKRPQRRKKSSKPSKADKDKEVAAHAGDVKVQQKSGKRKRGDGVAEESVDVEPKASERNKVKDRKKKRRAKGQEEKNDDGEEKESPIVDENDKGTVESCNVERSEQNTKKVYVEPKASEGNKEKYRKKKRRTKCHEEKNDGEDEKESPTVDGNDKGAVESCNAEQSEQNSKKVYVGGIPYYSTEDDIRSYFESCGTLNELDCMTFPESGKFRGIAIITFNTKSAAEKALALDGADMGGFYLKIQPYKSNRVQKTDFAPEMVDGYNRIYAGNLSWDITEDDLRKLFSDCKVSSIRFGTDKATDEFKGFAHIDFADSVSLTVALKLDQSMVCGRPIRIRCAVPLKKVETKSSSKPAVKKDEDSQPGESSKKKRRTCYVCGVPGHLSSSCPKKAASSGGVES